MALATTRRWNPPARSVSLLTALMLCTACEPVGIDQGRIDAILALEPNVTDGHGVFLESCGDFTCHTPFGVNGVGADLSMVLPTIDDPELVRIIADGRGDMPAQHGLSDQDIADVIAYLRETF